MLIEWINFAVLILSTLLTLAFYVKSVGPAALAEKIGEVAYKRCTIYRMMAGIFMTIAMVNYVLYTFYPLSLPLPDFFPWHRWISISVAILIALPSGYIWSRGMKDAGEETMIVKQEHTLYGGIYEKIRHPQAVGEMPFWFVIAFLLHSPFLVLYSFVWVPIFWIMSMEEEKDLIIRYGQAYEEYRKRVGAFFPKWSP
jgi:protein-S-isoprenylcysteine O-methyltransferase Ste14